MTISTLIMTLNEEANLPACLKSLEWCDDIVVLDSFSTDRTVEIAQAAGARVYRRRWDSESGQRMYGLREISYRHRWVFTPDADEITPDDLRRELLAASRDPDRPECAFLVRRKDMFMGKWIRRSSLYPTFFTRLVRPERVKMERDLHSYCVADGPVGYLDAHLLHYSFRKGVDEWFGKHNRYSSVEATIATSAVAPSSTSLSSILSGNQRQRRDAMKRLVAYLPFRPTLRFIYMYLLRRGFQDGWAGYSYCRMIASYELMIIIKTAEMQRRQKGLPL